MKIINNNFEGILWNCCKSRDVQAEIQYQRRFVKDFYL